PGSASAPGSPTAGMPRSTAGLAGCSMNATCRQVLAPSAPVLSYDDPRKFMPSSGTAFHSLQATSHALQPMQIDVSVKNPLRAGASVQPASGAGSSGPKKLLLKEFPPQACAAGCLSRP